MRNLAYAVLIICLTSFGAKAQTYYGSVNNFVINSGWNVVPNSTSTTINFKVTVIRQQIVGSWGAFNMNFKVGLAQGTGGGGFVEYLSPTYNISSSNFVQNSAFYDATYSFNVPSSKLLDDYYLVLYYNVPNNGSSYYQYYPQGATQINNPSGPTFDPVHIAKIQSMGFSTTEISNYDANYYLIEGDIMLSKTYVNGWTSSTPSNQVNTYNINILKPSFLWQSGGPWESAFFRAIYAWNSMENCNIKLHIIDESTNIYGDAKPIDISIASRTNLTSRPVISSFPIGNGKPGSHILINQNFKYPGTNATPTVEQATWNLVQAIGHALGFKHVNGTGTENSVMRINTSTSSYSSQLNAPLDANPINAIYPIDANSILTPSITGVNTMSYMSTGSFKISYYEPNISYSWRVVGRNGTAWDRYYEEDYSTALPELGLPKGEYQVRCTISGGKFATNTVTATKDIIVN